MQTNLFKAATDANETFSQERPENQLKAPIEIIVAGATHTGKSLITAIIEKALQDAGYTGVVLIDSEESPELRADMVAKAKLFKSFPGVETMGMLGKPITLRQANMQFVPPTE